MKPNIWKGGNNFIVQTGVAGTLQMGRLVKPSTGYVSNSDTAVFSIFGFMPYTEFERYDGDPAPLLDLLKTKAGIEPGERADWNPPEPEEEPETAQ